MYWLEVIIGICLLISGAKLGLRRVLYVAMAFCAGFAAVSLLKAFWGQMTSHLSEDISRPNAAVVSFLLLAVPPLLIIPYLGRKLMVPLGIAEEMNETIDRILGAGFSVAIYIGVLQIIQSWGELW